MPGMLIVTYQRYLQKMQQPAVKANWENYWNTAVQIKKKKKKAKLPFLQLKKPTPYQWKNG